MTTELMLHDGYRYLLFKRFDYVWTSEENEDALDEWDGSEPWDERDEWDDFDEPENDEAQEAREELEAIIAGMPC
jgi:hypothetical protein